MSVTLAGVRGCVKKSYLKCKSGYKNLYVFIMNIELIVFRYRVSCARPSASAGARGTAIKFLGICL